MIFDITQPLFGCAVYPGDPAPEKTVLQSTEKGDIINLTSFSMCSHNGTHIDAPLHFIGKGKSVDQIPLEKFVGPAFVATHDGFVTAADAEEILEKAKKAGTGADKRILIRGRATITKEAAEVFAKSGIYLLGNESQTVGPESAPMEVHLILLNAEVVILEGVRLSEVPDGAYLLNCAPLNLNGAEGAPCRAILIK